MVNEQNKLNNIREKLRKKILGAGANFLLTTGGIDVFSSNILTKKTKNDQKETINIILYRRTTKSSFGN